MPAAVSVASTSTAISPTGKAGGGFQRGQVIVEPVGVGARRLWQHDAIGPRRHDCRQVGQRVGGVERVDPDPMRLAAVRGLEVLRDRDARIGLGAFRDGILEVDDDEVGGAQPGFLELAGRIAGGEQQRAGGERCDRHGCILAERGGAR